LWFELRYELLLISNTTLQTRGCFEALVDKPVDKTPIISIVSSTRPVLEALVDKVVDKKPIFSTVSSTRAVLEALVDKPVDKTPIISTVSSTRPVLMNFLLNLTLSADSSANTTLFDERSAEV